MHLKNYLHGSKNTIPGCGNKTSCKTKINCFLKGERLYLELAENIATDRVIQKDEEHVWRCLSCGYLHTGKAAPKKCPACVKPAGFFELLCENW